MVINDVNIRSFLDKKSSNFKVAIMNGIKKWSIIIAIPRVNFGSMSDQKLN